MGIRVWNFDNYRAPGRDAPPSTVGPTLLLLHVDSTKQVRMIMTEERDAGAPSRRVHYLKRRCRNSRYHIQCQSLLQ